MQDVSHPENDEKTRADALSDLISLLKNNYPTDEKSREALRNTALFAINKKVFPISNRESFPALARRFSTKSPADFVEKVFARWFFGPKKKSTSKLGRELLSLLLSSKELVDEFFSQYKKSPSLWEITSTVGRSVQEGENKNYFRKKMVSCLLERLEDNSAANSEEVKKILNAMNDLKVGDAKVIVAAINKAKLCPISTGCERAEIDLNIAFSNLLDAFAESGQPAQTLVNALVGFLTTRTNQLNVFDLRRHKDYNMAMRGKAVSTPGNVFFPFFVVHNFLKNIKTFPKELVDYAINCTKEDSPFFRKFGLSLLKDYVQDKGCDADKVRNALGAMQIGSPDEVANQKKPDFPLIQCEKSPNPATTWLGLQIDEEQDARKQNEKIVEELHEKIMGMLNWFLPEGK